MRNKNLKPRVLFLIVLVFVTVFLKALPYCVDIPEAMAARGYLWNFSPVLPLVVFCGLYFVRQPLLLLVPLLAIVLGDVALGAASGHWEWVFYPSMWITYLGYFSVIGVGFLLRRLKNKPAIAAFSTGIAGGTAFFLVTNGLIWVFGDRSIYPYATGFSGLLDCYVQAIPFYRQTVLSMVVYLPLLFSTVGLVELRVLQASDEVLERTGQVSF